MTAERRLDQTEAAASEVPILDAWAAARGSDPAALARHLPHWVGKTWAQLEAEAEAMGCDPEARAEAEQLMAEFANADAETAAMIDQEDGPYPYTEADLAELQRLRAERSRP